MVIMNQSVPEWLTKALVLYERPVEYPSSVLAPGEFRICTSLDGKVRELVVILESSKDYKDVWEVALCSIEYEMGASQDILVKKPFWCIVQTDMIGPVWASQFDPCPLGFFDLSFVAHILKLDEVLTFTVPAGVPCRDRRDPRWKWKEKELVTKMWALSGTIIEDILGPYDWGTENE